MVLKKADLMVAWKVVILAGGLGDWRVVEMAVLRVASSVVLMVGTWDG
jgi:hypothetical protein